MEIRIVPWSSNFEWQRIKNDLFSENFQEKERGIKQCKAWKSRGKIPMAVDSTAAITAALLHCKYMFGTIQNGHVDRYITSAYDDDYSLVLGMAIVRFVNGVVEGGQKGALSASVSTIAQQLGLPNWFVEIRHQATHDKMPPLPLLKKCAAEALEWLWYNYWIVQDSHLLDDASSKTKLLLETYWLENSHKESILEIKSIVSEDNFQQVLLPPLIRILMDENTKLYKTKFKHMFKIFQEWWQSFEDIIADNLLYYALKPVENPKSRIFQILSLFFSTLTLSPESLESLARICLQTQTKEALGALQIMQEETGFPPVGHRYHLLFNVMKKTIHVETESKYDDLHGPSHEAHNTHDEIGKEKKEELQKCNKELNDGWELAESWTKCPLGCLPGYTSIPDNLELPNSFDDWGWLNENGLLMIPTPDQSQPSLYAVNLPKEKFHNDISINKKGVEIVKRIRLL